MIEWKMSLEWVGEQRIPVSMATGFRGTNHCRSGRIFFFQVRSLVPKTQGSVICWGDRVASRPSIAKDLFKQIISHDGAADSVSYLRAMVNSNPPTVETEFLDFKGASVKGNPIPDSDVKKTWSEALAGFANTSGGVLIWGIDAREAPGTKVDHASGFGLCLDPNGLRSRLQQLHHQSTDPPIPGVKIETFPDHAENGQGFVVCYIPESDYKPHRCETSGKRWVMRVGDSFVDIPVPVLRSLFFPQRRSYLSLRATPKTYNNSHPTGNTASSTVFSFFLHNEGPATANDLVIIFKEIEGVKYSAPTGHYAKTPMGWRLRYPEPVHPGTMIKICDAGISFKTYPHGSGIRVEPTEMTFGVQLFATDQVPQLCKLYFTAQEVLQELEKSGSPVPMDGDRFR